MLGDLHIAEPGAQIGFAGRRVIQETIRAHLPEGFQTAEYLRDHGMVDMVVPRGELREKMATIIRLLMKADEKAAGKTGKGKRAKANGTAAVATVEDDAGA
jgi:acetyl-CoA carboxylase carboxyl transferase subunit beta